MEQNITIVGCGLVGACIAYELSTVPGLQITVLEAGATGGLGATGAALGICMGVISQRTKGVNWRLRSESLRRYESLIEELTTGSNPLPILYNCNGIVKLCGQEEDWERWATLRQTRESQGFRLDLWSVPDVQACFPALNLQTIQGAMYSPHDRQVHPQQLLEAIVSRAQQQGVQFIWQSPVAKMLHHNHHIETVVTTQGDRYDSDVVILTAGLGNNNILGEAEDASLTPLDNLKFQPVLGQAWEVSLPRSLWDGETDRHPVLTVRDIHFVPLGKSLEENIDHSYLKQQDSEPSEHHRYWVGATVEFPSSDLNPLQAPDASETMAADLWQNVTDICPLFAEAHIDRHWFGLRPRPLNQPAPVLQWSKSLSNLLWASGHYRNGIFLAPASALWVKRTILERIENT